jgi:hypothetical protein
MTESKPPKLRIVRDPNDPEFELIPAPPRPKPDQSEQPVGARLPRANPPFVRVPLVWIADDRWFSPRMRLLLVLAYRSREGRQPVKLSAAIEKEANIPSRQRHRLAQQLERLGAVQVKRDGRRQLTLTVLRYANTPVWPK